jgi:uncharacterized protein (TIGR03086 family)
MTQISEHYAKLSQAFADKVAAVPDDKWSSPSPCPDWTARDVVRHVVDTQGMFLGFVDRKLENVPSVDDDPLGAWNAARAQVQAGLDDPQTANTEYEGFAGKATFEDGVERFLCMDLVVHNWDLSRAAGLDDTLDPAEWAIVEEKAKGFGEAMRSPGAFGPAVDAPAGADDQTRILAYLGRQA